MLVQFLGHGLDALQDDLRLLANAHQDYAFDGFWLSHVAKLSKSRRVPYAHFGQILHVDRDAALRCHHDVADLLYFTHQSEAANVVKLTALRVEPAARIGVVASELLRDLWHGHVVLEELGRIEQHLVLHGRAAESRVIGDALNGTIVAFDDPVLYRFQLLRAAVGALQHVAVNQPTRTEQRREARLQTCWQGGIADPFESQLTHEVRVGAVVEIHGDGRQPVERDRA